LFDVRIELRDKFCLDYDQGKSMDDMSNPPRSGKVLKEYLPDTLSVTGAGSRLGGARQTLSAILNSRAGISTEIAVRLSRGLSCRLYSSTKKIAAIDVRITFNDVAKKSTPHVDCVMCGKPIKLTPKKAIRQLYAVLLTDELVIAKRAVEMALEQNEGVTLTVIKDNYR
jgi:hypothetical protein